MDTLDIRARKILGITLTLVGVHLDTNVSCVLLLGVNATDKNVKLWMSWRTQVPKEDILDTIQVDREILYQAYNEVKAALGKLELLMADLGCLHPNRFDVTTMDGSGKTKELCPDCGVVLEEEIKLDVPEI